MMQMRRVLLIMVRVAVFAYLGLCGVLFVFQRSFLYFPPGLSDACSGTTMRLPVAAERVLVCTRQQKGKRALLYFGGNAEDVSENMPLFSAEMPDRALFLLHYRGYGGSSGTPSQRALLADGLALFDEVHRHYPEVQVVGRSLGSGIAVYLASVRPVARLVLVTPYNSMQELAARQFPYLPVAWLLLDRYESWRYAPAVRAPTLMIAAEHDQVVPRSSTELLRTHFQSGLTKMVVLAHTDHNTISGSPEYMPLLKDF